MKDGTLPENTNGSTRPTYDRINKVVTTTFDSHKYVGGSDLAIARTILHESVHAYLVAYFGIDGLAANQTYSKLIEDFNKIKDSNQAHHNEMVNSFVATIADDLKTFGKSQGYTLTDQFYNDMAWGGLTNTKAFQAFDDRVQGRIQNVLSSEQKGLNSRGRVSPPLGKLAGCQ